MRRQTRDGKARHVAAVGVVILVAMVAGGCGDVNRTSCIARANEVLRESLRNDQSDIRALSLEAYRDLNRTAPAEELEVIIARDLVPARFEAMLARAEQARRTYLRMALLSTMRDRSSEGAGQGEPFRQAEKVLPRAVESRSAVLRTVALDIQQELQARQQAVPGTTLATLLSDPRARDNLASMLAEAEQARRQDQAYFVAAMEKESDANVRLAIVYGQARVGDHRQMRLLAEGLSDIQPSVRRNAAMILGYLGNRSAVELLRPRLTDRDAVARLVAAEAVVLLGDTRGLSVIRSLAFGQTPTEPWIQAAAILAVGRVGIASQDVESLRLLEVRTGAVEGAVRLAAFGARGMLGDYSQMALLAEGASGRAGFDTQGRALALQLLARTSYGPAWRDACKGLSAGDAVVRLSAAWAVLAFNNPRADQVIEAVTRPGLQQWLTEEEILRPYSKPTATGSPRETMTPTTPPGPLGPMGPLRPLGR